MGKGDKFAVEWVSNDNISWNCLFSTWIVGFFAEIKKILNLEKVSKSDEDSIFSRKLFHLSERNLKQS